MEEPKLPTNTKNDNHKPQRSILGRIINIFFKTILVLVIIAMLLVFAFPKILSLFWGKDDVLNDDSDLMLKVLDIKEEDNSFFDLIKIKDVLDVPSEAKYVSDVLNSDTWDDEEVEEVIEENKLAFSYFDDAVKKDSFLIPELADPANIDHTMPVYPMNHWRSIARLSTIKAIHFAKNGQSELAIEEAFKNINIGHKIEASKQITVIGYLVGMSIKKLGLDTMQKIMISYPYPEAVLDNILHQLSEYETIDNSSFMKVEYLGVKNTFMHLGQYFEVEDEDSLPLNNQEISKQFVNNNFYYKPNQTINVAMNFWRDNVARIESECNLDNPVETPAFTKLDETFFYKFYITENFIGRLLLSLPSLSLNNVKNKKCENQAKLDALKTTIALEKYYIKNKDYAKNLDDLSPEFIDNLPKDPFTNENFIYNTKTMTLYSVGYDFVDNDGCSDKKISTCDNDKDIICNIDFATSSYLLELDSDKDGISDTVEQKIGTDKNNADTDGDGYLDGYELENGYNPVGDGKL